MSRSEWFLFVKQHNRCPMVEHRGNTVFERFCLECKHHYYERPGDSCCCPRCAARQPEPVVETAYVASRDLPLPDSVGDFQYRQVIYLYEHPTPVEERPTYRKPDPNREIRREHAA